MYCRAEPPTMSGTTLHTTHEMSATCLYFVSFLKVYSIFIFNASFPSSLKNSFKQWQCTFIYCSNVFHFSPFFFVFFAGCVFNSFFKLSLIVFFFIQSPSPRHTLNYLLMSFKRAQTTFARLFSFVRLYNNVAGGKACAQ